MATIIGIKNYLATGDAFCGTPDSNNKNHSFFNRAIRMVELTLHSLVILVVAPIAIVIHPILIFKREFSDSHHKYNHIPPKCKNKDKIIYKDNQDNIISKTEYYINNAKCFFIQLLLLPGYITYSIVFAGLDIAVFILNDLIKEEDGYFLKELRKEQVNF